MGRRHNIRELALQALYQLDARGEQDMEHIERAVGESPYGEATQAEALKLARAAWEGHGEADALSAELAPKWPPHRQPPVDRSIIRLAYHEMYRVGTPPPVAIDEAVELAKAYGSERSAAFINGVLDRMAGRLPQGPANGPPGSGTGDDPRPADAMRQRSPVR